MDICEAARAAGFDPVIALVGAEAELPYATVLLCFVTYEAEKAPSRQGAWIHPYYPASQLAYRAAAALEERFRQDGIDLRRHNEIRLKPLFARLGQLRQGKNTLSYLPGVGSRFHVQVLAGNASAAEYTHLSPSPKPLMCGDCRRCEQACPTGAITGRGFVRERCLRNWQLGGAAVPEGLRAAMGNRLIGCDECQRSCPHNPPPTGPAGETVPLSWLLSSPKEAAQQLSPLIGSNLALPNRLAAQACLLAGCAERESLGEALTALAAHPSAQVREHARWALKQRAAGSDHE